MYLRVIKESGEGREKKNATKVLHLLERGKHWVLVTLLLSNVITNETLPIVLDRSLGGGWPAVLGSTVLIVIFGEIVPQSICVRYGLPIGAWMAPAVLTLMYAMAPVAWPTAKLLDYLLGEDHGTVYKKAGLKTLVSFHKNMGDLDQQLNTDEVTIISACLDLKDKAIGSIMTPMDDVFTLSLDDVLDEEMMDDLSSRGYSRVPVHHPDNNENFIGMLLVKMLITYDPEDARPVREFALATLPETRPDTSCLDIINFFQEGKSHMILVSEHPGEDRGAIGVVTLEDVIEELIGEEIVDESDVFIDVHKAIRRAMPAPRMRVPKGHVVEDSAAKPQNGDLVDIGEHETLSPSDIQRPRPQMNFEDIKRSDSQQRRRSSTNSKGEEIRPLRKTTTDEVREHLKHLGPSNLASRPKTTRFQSVKIKPGSLSGATTRLPTTDGRVTPQRRISESATSFHGGIGEGILGSAGKQASDGVQALQAAGYGTMSGSPNERRPASANKAVQAGTTAGDGTNSGHLSPDQPRRKRSDSTSTVGSLPESRPRSRSPWKTNRARTGSLTTTEIEGTFAPKAVLVYTSGSESNDENDNSGANKGHQSTNKGQNGDGDSQSKTKRRKKKRPQNGEEEPLLR
jgi:metal transporter CNNM